MSNEHVSSEFYVTDRVGTHLPILDLIKRLLSVRIVLELGCGTYSTNKLLELPSLELLNSHDDSLPWLEKMAKIKDARLRLVHEPDMLAFVRTVDLAAFDLIFLDCCELGPERVEIVKVLAPRRPKAVVIIHDFNAQQKNAPESIQQFDNVIIYEKLWPTTAILWNQIEGSAEVQNVTFTGINGFLDL